MHVLLSAAQVPRATGGPEARATPLPEGARRLLECKVRSDSSDMRSQLQEHPQAADELKTWFGRRGVVRDPVGRALFRATPPAGTAVRLARRVGATLGGWGELAAYRSLREYKRQISCVREWYKRGKRLTRRRMGTRRDTRALPPPPLPPAGGRPGGRLDLEVEGAS